MSVEPTSLPEDIDSLRTLALRQQVQLEAQQTHLEARDDELRILREYVRILEHYRFGRKSEKHGGEGQLWIFDEAEAAVVEGDTEDEETIEVEPHTRRKRGRAPLPDGIPRVEVLHDLPEAEKRCPEDGTALERIGESTCEQLEFIPAKLRVLKHVRPKYACPVCRTGIHTAPLPPQPIPKSLASPRLLAQVAVSKYVDGLPLYRQETMFRRMGVTLPRTTLARWMVQIGELVQPLINLLRDDLLDSGFVQCDETRFQVLKEPGKPATSQSYLWVQRSADPAGPVVLYDYDPSRSAEVPKRLLAGFAGYLQTDGYEGYGSVGREPGITHVGCWAHTRRKFDEALKGQSGKHRKRTAKQTLAHRGLAYIQKLYKIEKQMGEVEAEVRQRIRDERSRPVMEAMRQWLDASLGKLPPQSLTGKALGYADGQWPKLVRVLEDGRLPLDTNLVENAIRPFVIGRKGWLFADTVAGAEASANLYSLVETAKANGIEPSAYLGRVLTQLPRATTLGDLEALLPRNLDRGTLQDPSRFASER